MDAAELEAEWDLVAGFLPEGWREAARTTGALQRARGVKDADALLRLILLHTAAGLSLRQTVARARVAELADVSDVALLNRMRAAEPWLQAMTQQLLAQNRLAPHALEVGGNRRIRMIDATDVKEPGATGTSWRVHYSLSLPTLACDFFEVTDIKGGETYKRVPVRAGDVVMGDRGYGHREGVAHVIGQHGEVIVRLNVNNFPLVNSRDRPFELLAALRTVRGRVPKEWHVRFTAYGKTFNARLCAIRKSVTAAERARVKAIREAKKDNRTVQPETLESAAYVFLLTTVPKDVLDARKILELYRARWQVEIAFKRLKSLMQAGHVPKYDGASARAWIQAKLLSVLLIERLQQAARFFPRGGSRSPRRSSWREFREARDSLLAVLSMPILPSRLIEVGPAVVRMLAERPRKRCVQIASVARLVASC